ncbi:restriction endonuclease type II-like protein [Pelagophyceae sp. CCMP2097]|nr:restriction endonuclease type II-like protein [Pelagophyceae sp. CCMP2097]|mmetsp:Transcript_2149/g.7849  ORF Transcript_2149/g.7849 Transcript_2149/m.7849 type:complete len:373 (-) Transcript_2149:21-1139(-)
MVRLRAVVAGNQPGVDALVQEAHHGRAAAAQPRLRHGMLRAAQSLAACDDYIDTVDAAQALAGVGAALAVKIVRAATATRLAPARLPPALKTTTTPINADLFNSPDVDVPTDDDDDAMELAPPATGAWRLVLLVDAREKCKDVMEASLLQKGVACEVRHLAVGDMVWVARSGVEERVLRECVVERKTASDLAKSIADGRYVEQKRRLAQLGVRGVYLVEGNFSEQDVMPKATLEQALVSTRTVDGLHVLRTRDVHGTISALAALHAALARKLARCGDTPGELFESFQKRAAKACATTVSQVFAWMLLQVPGCGPKKTAKVLEAYQTMHALTNAYRAAGPARAELLLEPLVGAATSRHVFQAFGPKPDGAMAA